MTFQVNLKGHDICGILNAVLDFPMNESKFLIVRLAEKGRFFTGGHIKAVPSSEKETLSGIAEEAIAQIDRRNYTQELEERGIRRIVKYGIAFSGKAVEVKTVG